MAFVEDPKVHLDKLQAEVNLVLESVGKVFAAVNRNPSTKPTAQANRLKQMIPGASDRFQDALAELAYEIHLAQAVMRRDLVLCREKAGLHDKPLNPNPVVLEQPISSLTQDSSTDGKLSPPDKPTDAIGGPDIADAADVEMKDEPIEGNTADTNTNSNNDLPQTKPGDNDDEKDASATVSTTEVPLDSKPTKLENSPLHLDVKSGPAASDEDKAPNTATTNNNDLDSLFGGPVSTSGEVPDFNFDQPDGDATDPVQDFNFDSFGADYDAANEVVNSDIASLLPGLEDYANTQPANTEVDFDALFGSGDDATNNTAQAQDQQLGNDDTFADLMDLANFDGTAPGDDQNGEQSTSLVDFDALFG